MSFLNLLQCGTFNDVCLDFKFAGTSTQNCRLNLKLGNFEFHYY